MLIFSNHLKIKDIVFSSIYNNFRLRKNDILFLKFDQLNDTLSFLHLKNANYLDLIVKHFISPHNEDTSLEKILDSPKEESYLYILFIDDYSCQGSF